MHTLELVSHVLCPYVQRIAIALTEKGIAFKRTYIDLNNKPEWFLELSPLGKVPLLTTDEGTIFESAAILEYLEDFYPQPLHPSVPFVRARHRAWIEFGSGVLNDIAGLYSAKSAAAFAEKCQLLHAKFAQVEGELGTGPWFGGEKFTLVDTVFAPVFRYWELFDEIGDFGIFDGLPKIRAWWAALAQRASVQNAVLPIYREKLHEFLRNKESYLSRLAA